MGKPEREGEEKVEAVVALCKCGEGGKLYGVRFERTNENVWKYTWAFPVQEKTAKREGYGGTVIKGGIAPDPGYPGCPYCSSRIFIICRCGKLNCAGGRGVGDIILCGWCGNIGMIAKGFRDIRSDGDR